MNYRNVRIVYEKNYSGRQRQARRKRPNAANTEMLQLDLESLLHTNVSFKNCKKDYSQVFKNDTHESVLFHFTSIKMS